MSSKPYNDPEKLARERWRGGEKHSYKEMAEELDCSPGTISIKMNQFEEELQKYGPSDFEDLDEVDKEDWTGSDLPYSIDLPDDWPPEQEVLDEMVAPGVDADVLVDEASWNCPNCTADLDNILREHFDTTLEDCIVTDE